MLIIKAGKVAYGILHSMLIITRYCKHKLIHTMHKKDDVTVSTI